MRGLTTFLAATSVMAASPAAAQSADAPDLIIAISVDQLSSDLYEEYAPYFRGGLMRIGQGTTFINGHQAQMATETCPGHSTLLTGSYPARTGIIGNIWIDLEAERDNKTIYCAEDAMAQLAEGERYRVSANHLLVPTLGERMKAVNAASRNVAVSGKDRSGVMMGGQAPDQRWYWTSKGWTSDVQGDVPEVVPAASKAALALIAKGAPALSYPDYCTYKSREIAVKDGDFTVGKGGLAITAGDQRSFQTSPAYDGAVLALAAALVKEMGLGKGTAPDLLSIGLSATDYVGHAYGDNGGEMCVQLFGLDQNLDAFFKTLDGWDIDYAVVLSSDHGVMDVPERLREKGVDEAQWVDDQLGNDVISAKIAKEVGLSGTLVYGSAPGDIHLNPMIPEDRMDDAMKAAMDAYRAHPQIETVFSADQLAAMPIPSGDPTGWSLAERARASFHPDRSGDLIVIAKQYVQPIDAPMKGYVATHGSPWDYDRRVPIIFWRPGGMGEVNSTPAATVDILPTLAAQIGLEIDGEIDGKCLDGVPGISCN